MNKDYCAKIKKCDVMKCRLKMYTSASSSVNSCSADSDDCYRQVS